MLKETGQAGASGPASLSGTGLPVLQDGSDIEHEGRSVVLQFGDLTCEANRVALIKALMFGVEVPGLDPNRKRLESAFMMLPSSTVYEVVSTFGKYNKSFSERASALLDGFKDFDVAERDAKTSYASL